MPDAEPPQDLVDARRAFLAADAELSRLAAGAPSAFGPDGRVAGVDPTLAERMDAVRGEMQRLALFISGHAWITGSGNRYGAWKQVDAAAKAPAEQ